MSRIYYEGKFYSYPLRAFEALWNLGIIRSTLCMASFAKAQLFPNKAVKSFEDWTVNQFGHKLYSIFFKTYTEKVWGMPCDEMSADWAAQRIKGLSLWGAVVEGPGMMWDAARDKMQATGKGEVMMGHALKQLASDGQGGWRMTATHLGGEVTIKAKHAISSAPMRELAARLHPLPATSLNAQQLRYRDFLTVALKIKADDLFPDNWIYIHDSKVKVGRIQNFRSWSPEMVPDESVACVGLEYFCFEGDGLWSMADDELIELATRELAQLGLVSAEQVIGGAVVRQEKAYPVYDEDYATHVAAMRMELEERHPSLHLVGRNGMHRYNNQDHAMMTAMLTVENIIAGARVYDTWCVNEDAEYHEAGDEGEQVRLPESRREPSEDQAAALASVREVPERIAPAKRRDAA
jgi:protoporphyrinogen oxidase